MKTKAFQTLLKVWITVASVAAFLFGWIVLGHSGKPVSVTASNTTTTYDTTTSQLSPVATLPPLPTLSSSSVTNGTLQSLPQIQTQAQPSSIFTPRLRTRGS